MFEFPRSRIKADLGGVHECCFARRCQFDQVVVFNCPFCDDLGFDSLWSELVVCGVWVCPVVVDDYSVSWLEVWENGWFAGFVGDFPLVLVGLLSLGPSGFRWDDGFGDIGVSEGCEDVTGGLFESWYMGVESKKDVERRGFDGSV